MARNKQTTSTSHANPQTTTTDRRFRPKDTHSDPKFLRCYKHICAGSNTSDRSGIINNVSEPRETETTAERGLYTILILFSHISLANRPLTIISVGEWMLSASWCSGAPPFEISYPTQFPGRRMTYGCNLMVSLYNNTPCNFRNPYDTVTTAKWFMQRVSRVTLTHDKRRSAVTSNQDYPVLVKESRDCGFPLMIRRSKSSLRCSKPIRIGTVKLKCGSGNAPLLEPSRARVSSLFSWSSMLSDCVTYNKDGRKERFQKPGNAERIKDREAIYE